MYLYTIYVVNFLYLCVFADLCLWCLDLEWKIIYVGSAESEEYDQTLDTVVVGPIIAGRHMFVFEVFVGIINVHVCILCQLLD